jgi:hypothetical protein
MKRIKIVFAIFLSVVILGSANVYGEKITKSIQVTYRNISILVNGRIVPSEQEPFIYQGRTFVPLRTIGEAVNKTVEWDNAKNQVSITDKLTETDQDFLFIPIHKMGERVVIYPYAVTVTKMYHGYIDKLGLKFDNDLIYVDVTIENISTFSLDIALSMPFSLWDKNSGKIAFLHQNYLNSLQLPPNYKSTSNAYLSQKITDEMRNKQLFLVFSPVADGYIDKFNNVFLAFDLGKIE